MQKLLFAAIVAACLNSAAAQTVAPQAVAESESMQVKGDFAGSLIITADADWKKKWDGSTDAMPSFAKAGVVAYGKPVFILTLFANPKLDGKGQANLRCDFKITNPAGKVQLSRKDLICQAGPLAANKIGVHLSEPVIVFTGDTSDAPGVWIVEVALRDANRKLAVALRSSFELKAAK